jgi:hypothetical protein
MQIVAALQARARAEHRVPLGEAEQRTVLETITNLPVDIIDRVVAPANAVPLRAVDTPVHPTAAPERSGTPRPWEHDFPVPIQDVMATASAAETTDPAAAVIRARRKTRGRHRH